MLIATFAGLALPQGATYELHVHQEADDTYTLRAFSAGAGDAQRPQGVTSFPALDAALLALLKKARDKRAGRERAYVNGVHGTPQARQATSDLPRTLVAGALPVHPQLWQVGRPIATLPPALRAQVAPTEAATAAVAADPVVPAAGATAPERTPGQVVMLCTNAQNTEALLTGDVWIATRKVEGRRAQLHRHGGRVWMTNRSGGAVACPAHIAEAAARLADGTTLDGELVALDAAGREALYVGAAADLTVFMAFDVLASPLLDGGMDAPQHRRLAALGVIVERLDAPDAVRIVPIAAGQPAKRAMLAEARAAGWEGLVFRQATAAYTGGRSGAWVRLKLRRADIDAVVMGYQNGTGRNTGTVSAVLVGLYDGDQLVPVGEVAGWDDAERAELTRRRDAGQIGYVVTVAAEGFTAGRQLNRAAAVCIRDAGDKLPTECRFASETANLPAAA